ncbi:ABC transporter permease [Halomicronema sp. CCY15110]|uniref:ABC transporter permease n=1 Tax=Halomicronema sp. CCY15110 TaxID=2767773 RepID=UPI00194F0434|nr:ABC transporter permease [Halomicronema sp. CCY15110]
MTPDSLGWWGIPLAILGGLLRGSVPFLFVSLGECLTEKSGKINLGLEGSLLLGAVTGYALSYHSGSAWIGVIGAGGAGLALGAIHAWLVQQRRVNDISVGIAMMIFGGGLANYLGKPYIQPTAPQLPALHWGDWSDLPAVQSALRVSPLLLIGIAIAFTMQWFFRATRWGLIIRAVGESPTAAKAMGFSVGRTQTACIMVGAGLAGIAGAYLSLYFPGSWNENISSGQGLLAVALVIFARWNPRQCLYAALLFGGTQGLGPALQSVGVEGYYYVFNAMPYLLTLVIMVVTCSPVRSSVGAPASLGQSRPDA